MVAIVVAIVMAFVVGLDAEVQVEILTVSLSGIAFVGVVADSEGFAELLPVGEQDAHLQPVQKATMALPGDRWVLSLVGNRYLSYWILL